MRMHDAQRWVAVVALALAPAWGWGCAGGPPPATGPATGTADAIAAEADAEAWAEAAREGVDAERLARARDEAERTVDSLDEASRREFYQLFGDDPLGLARRPANAARFEIPLETNDAVDRWIEFFTTGNGRSRFHVYLERAGAYEEMIRRRLREAELPEDLLYLAMIESGMNPNAYSRAHAVGMWQFIRGTARRYDLRIDGWVDERRDPFAATDAAIAHLGDLYDEFGSWYLAAAAYNAGAGRVSRGIRSTGSTDFWDLADARVLRSETRNYVPKLIAAALIAKNPERYGFTDVRPQPPLAYDVVTVPDATSFDVLAEAAGTTEDEIRRLNPHFTRRVTPPKEAAEVRVPGGAAERFVVAYAAIPPSERVTWLEHVVTRGQTLSHISSRYGVSVAAIRDANGNVQPRRLQIGQTLIIPRSGGRPIRTASAPAGPRPDGPLTVTVRRGDTLWAIARRHGVSTGDLMALNQLRSSVIRPGDRLTVRR
ncbi:MAG: LysM peptidoglycan-binding domain-containing protein [Gemmatimonadota bacterium]|nr:LysM peptidoglycan-binding domain-containing protein [Gemmatimonadota bacterium]